MTAFVPLPRPLRPLEAVVWDYDGTLVDTRSHDVEAVTRLVAAEPAAAPGVAVFWATEGLPIVDRIERAWPGSSARLLPYFDRRVRPRCFAGVPAVLDDLARRGVPMAVVSSRRRDPLRWGLGACGLAGRFGTVVSVDDVEEAKPSPEGLLLALRRLGVHPSRAVYVGDRDVDLEAARRAAMVSWQAAWSTPPPHPAGPVELAHPGEVLERFEQAAGEQGGSATG